MPRHDALREGLPALLEATRARLPINALGLLRREDPEDECLASLARSSTRSCAGTNSIDRRPE